MIMLGEFKFPQERAMEEETKDPRPPGRPVSQDAIDLVRSILQPNPSKRATLEHIK